jgi:two-component system, NarL family, response regulator NreC
MIADDHAILRAGLKMLVNVQADMEVVSEAPDGEKAVQTARETKPDVALLDLTMPRVGGMKALQKMARDCRETRVLVLTMHDDPAYLRSALAAGASGYLLKRAVDAELIAAIRAVHRGGIFVDPRLANVLVQDVLAKGSTKAGPTQPVNILSQRELQVLTLVARGYTSAEIAKQIFVGVKTIETYRSRFAEKLGLRTRSDVIRFAVQMGLLTPEAREIRQTPSFIFRAAGQNSLWFRTKAKRPRSRFSPPAISWERSPSRRCRTAPGHGHCVNTCTALKIEQGGDDPRDA